MLPLVKGWPELLLPSLSGLKGPKVLRCHDAMPQALFPTRLNADALVLSVEPRQIASGGDLVLCCLLVRGVTFVRR